MDHQARSGNRQKHFQFSEFLSALDQRHDEFHQAGCRLSDHGLEHAYGGDLILTVRSRYLILCFQALLQVAEDAYAFKSFLMVHFGKLDAAKGWTKQMHLGAYRNVNSRKFQELGPDTGFDSMGIFPGS